MAMSQLDAGQIIKTAFDDATGGLKIKQVAGSLVTDPFDYVALTYVAAGNGAGEVQTVTYKNGGSGGTTVATLTLAYNASNQLISVTKS